jgi:predicted esterase
MLVLPNLIEDVPTVTKIRIWHGKSDDVINCEIAKKSYETILKLSNVKMSVVDGVGHEAPSVITSQLYKFLLE